MYVCAYACVCVCVCVLAGGSRVVHSAYTHKLQLEHTTCACCVHMNPCGDIDTHASTLAFLCTSLVSFCVRLALCRQTQRVLGCVHPYVCLFVSAEVVPVSAEGVLKGERALETRN